MKTTTEAKKTNAEKFQRLFSAAEAHYQSTGDFSIVNVMMCAEGNAADSAHEEGFTPYSDEYYSIALGSIRDSVDANNLGGQLTPWFANLGHTM